MKVKMTEEEMKAAAYYLGMSNLGQTSKRVDDKIKEIGPDWEKIYNLIRGELANVSESDEMYDYFIKECNFFLKDLHKGNISSQSWVKFWKEHKKAIGLPEN